MGDRLRPESVIGMVRSTHPTQHDPGRGITSQSEPSATRSCTGRRASESSPRRGSRFVERILTVVTSLRMQNRNVLDYLTAAITAHRRGVAPPSILPQQADALSLAA
jgi:hypothetical protein